MQKLFAAVALALAARQALGVAVWGQCGGIGYSGSTVCDAGTTCVYQNDYYSQCKPGGTTPAPTTAPTTSAPGPTTVPPPTNGCPKLHVFGARETTVSPGYGTAGQVVNSILSAYPGSDSEAISYPACGGQSSCGSVSYADSVKQGVKAVASQVNAYNSKCPNTWLVFVGYSQGGQIFDNAYCGGGDTNEGITDTSIPISAAAQKMVKAAIFMGDPRFIKGLSYNVGTCQAQGFAPRPAGFQCPYASNIQSYCDAADPYCCNGSSQATHQGYASEYGSQALAFVKSKVGSI